MVSSEWGEEAPQDVTRLHSRFSEHLCHSNDIQLFCAFSFGQDADWKICWISTTTLVASSVALNAIFSLFCTPHLILQALSAHFNNLASYIADTWMVPSNVITGEIHHNRLFPLVVSSGTSQMIFTTAFRSTRGQLHNNSTSILTDPTGSNTVGSTPDVVLRCPAVVTLNIEHAWTGLLELTGLLAIGDLKNSAY